MSISWIPLTADGVSLCASLWSDRRAYTSSEFMHVTARLRALLRDERARGALILEGPRVRGYGISVFADRHCVNRLLAAPQPQLAKRLLLEESGQADPVLDRCRIGEANATGGLELVVVSTNYDVHAKNPDAVIGAIIGAFQAVHAGYHIARIVNEVSGEPAIEVAVTSRSFDVVQRFTNVGGVKGLSSVLMTLTRERAAANRNPLMAMFVYSPPRIQFTEAEQAILQLALTGLPDGTIARQLGLQTTAVKGRWTRLQERAFSAVPELLPPQPAVSSRTVRGPQNRHWILEYVRQHPSELRPFMRPVQF